MVSKTDDWTQTYTGQRFYFHKPERHEYSLEDIAHQLAMICRFGGSCLVHYSVGYHSLLLAEKAYALSNDPKVALDSLFHDASKAYTGDLKRSIKVQLPEFKGIEDRIDKAIREQFKALGLPSKELATTKALDQRILVDERRQIMRPTDDEWKCLKGLEPLGVIIKSQRPERVRDSWLRAVETFASLHQRTERAEGCNVVRRRDIDYWQKRNSRSFI